MPRETAAVSAHVSCTPYNHACTSLHCHFIRSHTRSVRVCLAVTCLLHFWQNDRDLLRATAVTRGWNWYRDKNHHRKLTLEKKNILLPRSGLEPRLFGHESGSLPLSYPRYPVIHQTTPHSSSDTKHHYQQISGVRFSEGGARAN